MGRRGASPTNMILPMTSNRSVSCGSVNPVPRTYVRGFRACPSGTSEHSPREIVARGVFKAMTEEIISRGHPCTYVQGVLWYGVKET